MFRIGRVEGRRREPRLDPVRWPRRPHRSTVVRGALVAVLLTTAAGVLYAGPPAPAGCPVGPREPLAAAASPTPTPRPASAPTGSARPDGRLPLPAGAVGVPVTLADPMTLAVVRPGDLVDLLTVPAGTATRTSTVATGALVLAAPGDGDHGAGPGALFLALTPEQARRTVELQATARFAIVIR